MAKQQALPLGLLLLTGLTGCLRPAKLGSKEIPPLPKMLPGFYCDINPRFSHDGKRIAFLRETPDRRLQLYIADPELDAPKVALEAESLCLDRSYSPSSKRYSSPDTLAWSPNDRLIAFERAEWFAFEDGEKLPGTGLWAFDTASGRVTPIGLHPATYSNKFFYYHSPAWSPDGKYLSFVAEGISGEKRVAWRPVSQKSDAVVPIFDNADNSDWISWRPQKSPDRSEPSLLTYRKGIFKNPNTPQTETLRCVRPGSVDQTFSGEIWRMSPPEFVRIQNGETPQNARDINNKRFIVVPRIGHLVWSPDGERLAFTLTPDANDFSRYEIWVWSFDTGEASRVSPHDGRGYFAPVWIDRKRLGALSPDGNHFMATSIGLASKRSRKLGSLETADCDWSPDRSRIVYATPKQNLKNDPDDVTSLKILETGIHITVPWRAELTDNRR